MAGQTSTEIDDEDSSSRRESGGGINYELEGVKFFPGRDDYLSRRVDPRPEKKVGG